MVKTTSSASKSCPSDHLGALSKMKTATESLSRIQDKQKMRNAELQAAEELANNESSSDLEKRLAEAGIKGGKTSADDELARILGK